MPAAGETKELSINEPELYVSGTSPKGKRKEGGAPRRPCVEAENLADNQNTTPRGGQSLPFARPFANRLTAA